jgi:hypothetical protein
MIRRRTAAGCIETGIVIRRSLPVVY